MLSKQTCTLSKLKCFLMYSFIFRWSERWFHLFRRRRSWWRVRRRLWWWIRRRLRWRLWRRNWKRNWRNRRWKFHLSWFQRRFGINWGNFFWLRRLQILGKLKTAHVHQYQAITSQFFNHFLCIVNVIE